MSENYKNFRVFNLKTGHQKGVIHKLRNAVRGGGGQPLCYAMMKMVSKIVYHVLRRGGGRGLIYGQNGVT